VGVALASAHVVGGSAGDRRDEHAAQRLADLVGVDVIEQGDPLAANLVAARDDRLGEDVDQPRQVGFIGQSPGEMEPG